MPALKYSKVILGFYIGNAQERIDDNVTYQFLGDKILPDFWSSIIQGCRPLSSPFKNNVNKKRKPMWTVNYTLSGDVVLLDPVSEYQCLWKNSSKGYES